MKHQQSAGDDCDIATPAVNKLQLSNASVSSVCLDSMARTASAHLTLQLTVCVLESLIAG